jgi:hypothetical protein
MDSLDNIPDPLIPDKHCVVLWNDDDTLNVIDVRVVDFRDQALYERIADNYSNSNGCINDGWLEDEHPQAQPAGIFGYMAFQCGFASDGVMQVALSEFGKIASASWARSMLAAVVAARSNDG